MGLTLDALKRIEAKSSQPRTSEPELPRMDAPSQSAVAELPPPVAPPEVSASAPPETAIERHCPIGPWVRSIEVAAETSFEQLETFVTLATESYLQTPAHPSREIQERPAAGSKPGIDDETAVAVQSGRHPRFAPTDDTPSAPATLAAKLGDSPIPSAAEAENRRDGSGAASSGSPARPEVEASHGLAGPQSVSCEDVPYQELADSILEQLTPNQPTALAFTSSGDGHGKTPVLARLAPALAERVARGVVVLDANFRNPDLGSAFGLGTGGRLPDVLRGKVAWAEAVRPTSVARLSLLAGGHLSDKALATERIDLGRLLRELKRHYGLVLVDVASMAHGEVASIIGCCEGTYLVEQLGRSNPRAVRQAARLIEQSHGCLLGCIAVG